MSDAIWFYARNDEEHGPVPVAKLKAMAAAGDLLPTDLVWKEGMEDWAPAQGLRGLFPPASASSLSGGIPVAPGATPPESRPPQVAAPPPRIDEGDEPAGSVAAPPRAGWRFAGVAGVPLRQIVRIAGWPVLLIGFLLVVWSRGCDSLNDRYSKKVAAEAISASRTFEQSHLRSRQLIVNAQKKIREMEEIAPAAQRDLNRLTDELNDLDEKYNREKAALEAGEWAKLKSIADNANAMSAVWAYYHELFFVFGALVLSVGLIAVGAAGDGAERWVCLVMLAIITFSIFVGGAAWLPPPG